jgi:hypothetical protein
MQNQILQRRVTSIVVALSDTEVGKVVLKNPVQLVSVKTGIPLEIEQPTLAKESEMLKYANAINDLMPQFIRQQAWIDETDGKEHQMMVMERLHTLPIHHFDLAIRTEMFAIFETKMKELHDNLFVHGDFERPTMFHNRNDKAWMFGNIVQTETALRLIDTGFSQIYRKANGREFFHIKNREQEEVTDFGEYYLE